MLLFSFVFTYSLWWLLPCFIAAALYSWLLYGKTTPYTKITRYILATIRFVCVLALCLFLVNPLLKNSTRRVEKPIVLIAQDNSSSLLFTKYKESYKTDYLVALKELSNELSKDYTVKNYTFGKTLTENRTIDFSAPETDLSQVITELDNAYVNQNVGALIMATDGIYTTGTNPIYSTANLKFPVYMVAMGDTTPQKDALIAGVDYNKIAYYKNDFRLVITVAVHGYKNTSSSLSVSGNKGTIFTKNILINDANYRIEIPVDIQANTLGFQQYTIKLRPLDNEITLENNTQTLFVEVVDGKQKVLLVAAAAHPDIAALKQSIETNENYQVDMLYAADVNLSTIGQYNLAILHQLPSAQYTAAPLWAALQKNAIATWFIIGNQTSTDIFNNLKTGLSITGTRNSTNEVQAIISPDFFGYTLTEATSTSLTRLAPLNVPFGNYELQTNFSTLLQQRIGSVSTRLPLLAVGEGNSSKLAFLCGEGLWKWRLGNYAETQNHDAFNELIGKTVQYLTTKNDKRKFRVRMDNNQVYENTDLLFYAELYNDTYELVNTPDVALTITNQTGKKYAFTFSKTDKSYQLNAGVLPIGSYTYAAVTKLGNKAHQATGAFVIQPQNSEQLQTTADHQLLNTIAQKTGGIMAYPINMQTISNSIKANELIKPISYEQKRLRDLINTQWLFAIIVLLLGTEWFMRKRAGNY